jgi:hypothetical protein
VNVSNIFNDIMYWIRVNYNTFQGFHDLTRFLNRIYDCQDHEVLVFQRMYLRLGRFLSLLF